MSTPAQPAKGSAISAVVVVAATVIFVVTIAAIVTVALAVENGARFETMMSVLAGIVTSSIGFLTLFVRQEKLNATVAQVQQHTTDLTNGLGDAKFRAAIADVLADHLIDPAAKEQLVRDRARRTAAAEAAAALVTPHVFEEGP